MNVNFGMNPYSTPTRRNMTDKENIFEIKDYMNFRRTYIGNQGAGVKME